MPHFCRTEVMVSEFFVIALTIFIPVVSPGHVKLFRSNFTTLASQAGLDTSEYDVVTDDDYILKLFRVSGDRNRPLLLVHGLFQCADDFMLRGRTSLVSYLARAGYDVWLANVRGTRYSRGHLKYNADTDHEYWNFSFHEFGYYDLPAIIDFILDMHNLPSLPIVGYSQGTVVTFILGSTRPEYNEKITLFVALAPIVFLQHTLGSFNTFIKFEPILNYALTSLGIVESFDERSVESGLFRAICTLDVLGYELCGKALIFPLTGIEERRIEPRFYTNYIARYFPSSTSTKNVNHFTQLSRRRMFAPYSYGPKKNLQVYNYLYPPRYNLSNVVMKVALFQGDDDFLSTVADTEMLRNRLSNVVNYTLLKAWTHLDFVYARELERYIVKPVLEVLKNYG